VKKRQKKGKKIPKKREKKEGKNHREKLKKKNRKNYQKKRGKKNGKKVSKKKKREKKGGKKQKTGKKTLNISQLFDHVPAQDGQGMYGVSAKPWKSWKQRRLCFSHFQPTCRVLSNHEKSSESAGLGHQGSFTWQMQGYPYFAPKMHLRPFKMKANISRYHTCHTSISNTMFIECSYAAQQPILKSSMITLAGPMASCNFDFQLYFCLPRVL